jgi:integrase
LPEREERVRELSADEEQGFLDSIRPDYQPLFQFSLATGIRMAGCLALQWSDIDWGGRELRVMGKGGKHYRIPVSSAMRDILWPLQGRHAEAVFTYVVQRTRGGRVRGECRPITASGLKTEFSRARAAAGLPSTHADFERGYRWHDNRHTRATRLLRQKGNLKMVQSC